ncbi:MAG: DinB family protein [Chitinophagaceae bacterium]|nr:MAG: DinB family protein [Chitinophagaceae bacterium]
MNKFKSTELLHSLQSDTRQIILTTKQLLGQDPELLITQPAPGKWSIAQAIEHLNVYGRYYLPAIKNALDENKTSPKEFFKAGWFGNYFTNSMKPTPDKQIKNKMKAMKGYRPEIKLDSKKVLEEFLQQQYLLLELLEKAAKHDIGRIRIPVSIARMIKLKLGDTFRFVIAHHQRHFVQCENTFRALGQTRHPSLPVEFAASL